jgi:hypothetical protein
MLGGMEEDPEVGDPPLAKLVGLDFGLPSSEDTVSCMLHQLLLLALLFLVLITWYLRSLTQVFYF